MFNFLKMSVSPATFAHKFSASYLANADRLERGFMKGLAGDYSEAQLKTIDGEISGLVAFAYEAAVRRYVNPEYHDEVMEWLILPMEADAYRASKDIGMTFMERCGFEKNAYIHGVGVTVFKTVQDTARKVIQQVRIEPGGS